MLSLYHKTIAVLVIGEKYSDGLTVCNYLSEFGNNIQTEMKGEDNGTVVIASDVSNSLLRIEILWHLDRHDEALRCIEK